MKSRRRLVTASAAAFVFSGAATLALSWRMAHVSAAESTRMRSYVAPARPVAVGQPLQAADLRLIPWPAVNPLPNAFAQVNDAVGRSTLYPISPGQPLLESDLTPRGAGPGLAGRIPDGMRALAIKSDEVVGVGGFLSPGLHVDMLVTLLGNGSAQTSTVLQNAEVIAVGQQSEPDPQGKPATATVVTLLLTPSQAERALLSSSQGSVHFVLRNSADRANLLSAPVTLADLGDGPAHPQDHLPLATAPAPQPRVAPRLHLPHLPSGPALPEIILSGHTAAAPAPAAGPVAAPSNVEGHR